MGYFLTGLFSFLGGAVGAILLYKKEIAFAQAVAHEYSVVYADVEGFLKRIKGVF